MKSHSKYQINVEGALLIVCLLSATLSGCASSKITAAEQIGTTGKAATLQAKNAILTTADEFHKTEISMYILYGSSTNDADISILNANVKKLDASYKELSHRAAMFDKLCETYTAFIALCTYNASTQTESALSSAMSSVNSYAQFINKPEPFSDTAVKTLSYTGGLFASEIQLAMIKASNKRIITILQAMHTLLSDKEIKEEFVTASQVFAAKRYGATQWLFEIGALDYSPILNDVICNKYFTLKKDFKPPTLQQEMLNNGIKKTLNFLAHENIASIETSYNTSLDLLQQLITAHEQFNAGKPFDLSAINALIANLQRFATILSESRTTS